MNREQLVYAAKVISAAPASDTGELRHKAAMLVRLADELDLLAQNATVARAGAIPQEERES